MGISHKSHGKRSDKETQSPMLKIFKDMMQKDKRDPEKTNLLKEKHHERKRKHYSGSRTKSGRQTVSSSSDHPKNEPYKISQHEARNVGVEDHASQRTVPFQKRESWWFWGDTDGKKSKEEEETCSCVSCVLKKLINTDYACIACITVLLVVSVIIALTLIYKSIPCTTSIERHLTPPKVKHHKSESERLKRKIESLGKWSLGPKKQWRNIFRRPDEPDYSSYNLQGNDLSSLVESENDLAKILDSDKLSDIQHSDRLRDFYKKLVQTDAAIRNLRKNLNDNTYSSTNYFDLNNNYDINSNLDLNNNYDINSNIDFNNKVDIDNKVDSERLKRSISFHPKKFFNFKRREPATQSKINNGKLITKSTINMTSNKKPNHKGSKNSRKKRFGNFSDEGFIIEKNKVMIQYKPSRVVAKCSHSPKDSKSHEKELAHPFYKSSQRLDELLDQFIDKKLPDLLANRLELGMQLEKDKNKKCKHPENSEVILVKNDELVKDYDQKSDDNRKDTDTTDYTDQPSEENLNDNERKLAANALKKEQSTSKTYIISKESPKIVGKDVQHSANVFENDFFEDSDGVEKKRETTSGYDILLSISTLVNPAMKRTTSKATAEFAKRPNLRKLLQVNMKAEDGVAYEDLKEVLADEKEGHDDVEREGARKKRHDYTMYDDKSNAKVSEEKRLPTGVHNPNWKGPMPLYPDELNQMTIKGHAQENKVDIPIHSQDSAPESDDVESVKSDVQYVEDYLHNGYERLVELAQAYSDYGVLNEKKNPNAEKKSTDKEHAIGNRKAGISLKTIKNTFKRGLKKKRIVDRLKKGKSSSSEGIRIEILPNPKKGEHNEQNPLTDDVSSTFRELLNKHVKIHYPGDVKTDDTKLSSFPLLKTTPAQVTSTKDSKNLYLNNDVIFKKRTLKGVDLINRNKQQTETSKFSQINFEKEFQFDPGVERELTKDQIYTDVIGDSKSKSYGENKDTSRNLESVTIGIKKIFLINSTDSNSAAIISDANPNKLISNNTIKSIAKENESSLSKFFMLLSKWFTAIDGMDMSGKNSSKVIPRNSRPQDTQIAYPEYNSDMVENIGHRSRALLSIEVSNNTEKAEEHLKSDDDGNQIAGISPSTESMNSANSTRSEHATTEPMKNDEAVSNETDSRVVKRQAIDDSNLIFWNDLYDEEYGINADPIESNVRDKHSAERNDLLKKSNTWIQDKMKKITERFYAGTPKKTEQKVLEANTPKHVKRNIKYNADVEDDYNPGPPKLDMAALTERMKAVCKETVKAVQETKRIQVREDNKEGQAAASLMQQLVRLMTDLVDFQVQERTCRRLPPDLQSFLEWLTSPKQDDLDSSLYNRDKNGAERFGMDLTNKLDKPTEQDLVQQTERENTDSKTDCLGTLHAVQNLIREYEEMTEDDKSVMTGVKSYLENQMLFLQRQLSYINDKYYDQGSRFRRDTIMDLGHTMANTIDDSAHHLQKQYNNFKEIYNKYKCKLAPAYQGALKTTADMEKAVTKMVHKLMGHTSLPPPSKCKCEGKCQCKKPKYPVQPKTHGQNKCPSLKCQSRHKNPHAGAQQQLNAQKTNNQNKKVNEQNKDLKSDKTQMNKKHKHHIFSFKMNSNAKDKGSRELNYGVDRDVYGIDNDEAFNDKNERNIKDVYFKAVADAKKSLSKGTHKRDSEVFDKADIYRINDYIGEREN